MANNRARARKTCAKASSLFAQVAGDVQRLRSKMHMAYGMCRPAPFRYTSHTECALRPPLFAQEIVRTRTIHWVAYVPGEGGGGGTRNYHNRALQASPSHPEMFVAGFWTTLILLERLITFLLLNISLHFPKLRLTGELPSSGDKAEHCSSSCTAEEDG